MSQQLMKTGEPYFYLGGEVGCLLIHGFTATPKEMSYLAQYLAEQGLTVLGIRLAGHATQPKDMARMKYQDWITSVENGYKLLKPLCKKIIVIGLSMGGALTLTFSSFNDVDGVIAMDTPYRLSTSPMYDQFRLIFSKLFSKFVPYLKKGPADWFHPERFSERISYDVNPTASGAELIKLLQILRVQIPKITAPTLIIHSIDDDYVVPENSEMIFNELTTSSKELFYIEESSHVITEDGNFEILFPKVYDFIKKISEK
jgi:carboxylesterase